MVNAERVYIIFKFSSRLTNIISYCAEPPQWWTFLKANRSALQQNLTDSLTVIFHTKIKVMPPRLHTVNHRMQWFFALREYPAFQIMQHYGKHSSKMFGTQSNELVKVFQLAFWLPVKLPLYSQFSKLFCRTILLDDWANFIHGLRSNLLTRLHGHFKIRKVYWRNFPQDQQLRNCKGLHFVFSWAPFWY